MTLLLELIHLSGGQYHTNVLRHGRDGSSGAKRPLQQAQLICTPRYVSKYTSQIRMYVLYVCHAPRKGRTTVILRLLPLNLQRRLVQSHHTVSRHALLAWPGRVLYVLAMNERDDGGGRKEVRKGKESLPLTQGGAR